MNDAMVKQTLRDIEAWFNGDSSKNDVLDESVYVYNPGLPDDEVHSRDAFQAYMDEIRAGFPDIHLSFEEVTSNDDIVMAEFQITGTHEAEFQGLPPTGRSVEIWGIDKLRIEDGTITEYYTYYDTQDIPDQLGLTFPEVVGQLPKLVWGKVKQSL